MPPARRDPPGGFRTRRLASLAALALFACSFARADVTIEVEGVDGEIRDNVLIFLSLSRYKDRDDINAEMMQRLHDRVDREVRQALRPFGYYEPKVTSELTPQENGKKDDKKNGKENDKNWLARINIDPGAPVIVRDVSVVVEGPGAQESAIRAVIDQSKLQEGARLEHPAYDKLKGDLQRTAVSIGYLDVKVTRSELLVDPPKLTADAHLQIETGQRYRFGAVNIEQTAIDNALAERFMRFREGDHFETLSLLKTQFAFDDSQYFSTVEVVPGTRDQKTLTVPVSIVAQTAKRDRYSIGAGYGTDTRWRGTLTWDVRRVNRKGHRARIELVGSDKQERLEMRYVIPVGDPALEKVGLDAIYNQEELADLDIEQVELRAGLTQIQGNKWQRVLFVSASNEVSVSPSERQEDTLLIPGISYAVMPPTFTGEIADIGRGLFAELTGSHSAFGSDADYLRLRVRDDHVFDIGEKWHLLVRGEIGTSFVADFSELPGSQRFFAGGDNSVRGFGLNELSPVDANGEKTGGRHLLVGSVEIVRDLPRNFGVAVFYDFGNAVNKLGDPLEYSAGIGIRWRLPIVTVGIDVAQALSRDDLDPRVHLNISPRL
jgi:translocation and assembly module TamA